MNHMNTQKSTLTTCSACMCECECECAQEYMEISHCQSQMRNNGNES